MLLLTRCYSYPSAPLFFSICFAFFYCRSLSFNNHMRLFSSSNEIKVACWLVGWLVSRSVGWCIWPQQTQGMGQGEEHKESRQGGCRSTNEQASLVLAFPSLLPFSSSSSSSSSLFSLLPFLPLFSTLPAPSYLNIFLRPIHFTLFLNTLKPLPFSRFALDRPSAHSHRHSVFFSLRSHITLRLSLLFFHTHFLFLTLTSLHPKTPHTHTQPTTGGQTSHD